MMCHVRQFACINICCLLLLCSAASAAEPQDAAPIVIEQCRIKFLDQVTLAADRAGIIDTVTPREGSKVESGAVVAKLRDEIARAAYDAARQNAANDVAVRFAKKSSEVADAEYRKALETNRIASRAVTEVELLRLKLTAEKSKLEIEQAEHELEASRIKLRQAEAELSTHRITTPFAGVVTQVLKLPGEAVRQGDPLLELSNSKRVRVEGYVSINDLWRIRPGSPVQVQLDIPNAELEVEQEKFEGAVVFVDLSVQPVIQQVRVWAEVENRDDILRAGLTARMVVQPQSQTDTQPNVTSRRTTETGTNNAIASPPAAKRAAP